MADIRLWLAGKTTGANTPMNNAGESSAVGKRKSLEEIHQKQREYDKKKRQRVVQQKWLEDFKRAVIEEQESNGAAADLEPSFKKSQVLYCGVCRKFPHLADTKSSLYVGVTDKFKRQTLEWHHKSKLHEKCILHEAAIQKPQETCIAKSITKMHEKNIQHLNILFNTAYYIAKQGEAFIKFPKLCSLQKKNNPEWNFENYMTDHACRNFVIAISETLKMTIRSQIENARFISVLSDDSTDKGIQEQELIYVRFVCEGTLVTHLCDIVSMKNSTSSGVKNAIMVGLESMGISLDILSQKCIGLNTDGAAVNLGTKSGAVKQLLDEVSKNQGWDNCNHIAVVHCVAHNLELAVCDVKKKEFIHIQI
ncbi:zinc finger protein 862-like [Lissotriton helveticus]